MTRPADHHPDQLLLCASTFTTPAAATRRPAARADQQGEQHTKASFVLVQEQLVSSTVRGSPGFVLAPLFRLVN